MNDRRLRFVKHYVASGNATKAYIEAGYSERGAAQGAERLLRNVEIRSAVDQERASLSERLEITQDWVIQQLVATYRQATADKQHGAATNAMKLIGTHLGMFVQRHQIEDLRTQSERIASEYGLDPAEVLAEAQRALAK